MGSGDIGSENADISNDKTGEKTVRRKPKVSCAMLISAGLVGPGESRHADIGISLPGSGENPVAPVFADGKKITALKGDGIADEFIALVEDYIKKRFTPSENSE